MMQVHNHTFDAQSSPFHQPFIRSLLECDGVSTRQTSRRGREGDAAHLSSARHRTALHRSPKQHFCLA